MAATSRRADKYHKWASNTHMAHAKDRRKAVAGSNRRKTEGSKSIALAA
jgi:hypothetical protein